MEYLERSKLWNAFTDKANSEQRAMVENIINDAGPLLDKISETFPTYTLHNAIHARNVVNLMGLLLGEHASELSSLELAFLILSAFLHDVGMVFRKEELTQITNTHEWEDFLEQHPAFFCEVNGPHSSDVPAAILENFCRWRHADRIFSYLDSCRFAREWNGVNISEALGRLCRSHNQDTRAIQLDDNLRTDFIYQADLKFCALILRLADMLDFDGSRAPAAVYDYLGIADGQTPERATSAIEWRKHFSSNGFVFPKERPSRYEIGFTAHPNDPAIEYDIRGYLAYVEVELEHCSALLQSCSDRHKRCPLPGWINVDGIQPDGYRYGAYKFSLSRESVLNLLMGDSLYSNKDIFIRELLQNSIDACRLRKFFEAGRRDDGNHIAVEISHWRDPEGYLWVRFDDGGAGIDQYICEQYLLRVGDSYYNSEQYRADVLKSGAGVKRFAAISRFGIGLLSCFMSGDRVEISSLRRLPSGKLAKPIRLSINGLFGFYKLQMRDLPADPMPGPPGSSKLCYRTKVGTSIAVRLDPTKESGSLDVADMVGSLLCDTAVPVTVNGIPMELDGRSVVESQWCDRTQHYLGDADIFLLSEWLGVSLGKDSLKIDVIPIDITKHSMRDGLRGQGIAITVTVNDTLRQFVDAYDGPSIEISCALWQLNIRRKGRMNDSKEISLDLSSLIRPEVHRWWGDRVSNLVLSFNGLRFPTFSDAVGKGLFDNTTYARVNAVVSLEDVFRPSLSVSRENLIELPWDFYSAISIAARRALAKEPNYVCRFNFISRRGEATSPLFETILRDPSLEHAWLEERLFCTTLGRKSLKELLAGHDSGDEVCFSFPFPKPRSGRTRYCDYVSPRLDQALAQKYFNLELDTENDTFKLLGRRNRSLTPGEALFKPLLFVDFGDHASHLLHWGHGNVRFNARNLFAKWMLREATILSSKYPGLFKKIQYNMEHPEYPTPHFGPVNEALKRLREIDPQLVPPGISIEEVKFTRSKSDILDDHWD